MNYTLKFIMMLTLVSIYSCQAQTSSNTSNTEGVETITKHVDANEFEKMIADGEVQLVDVRTPQEFTQGHIEGAEMINVSDRSFVSNAQKLDKSKPVLVYCRSGVRSKRAMNKLTADGFRNVVNLLGGFRGWSGSGKKVVR